MINIIAKVKIDSIAEEVGIECGDKLLSINGNEIKDIIDYRFLIADDYLEIEVEKENGEIWEIDIEKDYEEKLGLEFEEGILDIARSCKNKCLFCFIDQLPKGMRETLYFKDDDSRLSFLQGNFITLTNMNDEEIDRIIKYKISPINISVHTTNPELRVKMLNNKNAGKLYERMERMAEAGIIMGCQIVLCPGINDGKELERTVNDLYKLYPMVQDVAVVPIGITKHRENLPDIEIYNKETALKQIKDLNKLQDKFYKEVGSPFVRLADEFYVMANEEIPESEFYTEFAQLEDGIGMLRMFRNNIENNLKELSKEKRGVFTFVTGASAYKEIKRASELMMSKNRALDIRVEMITNEFFGETITVTGLLTGQDIVRQLKEKELGEFIILPDNVIKRGYELGEGVDKLLLDDYTVERIEEELGRKVLVVDYTGEDLIHQMNKVMKER
ncbi:DUF512 domain-containing protein [Oceanirhabdus sp. W0125-5]|uniref:DUF512 domain-containing protein n=1 Tax=Oceanirhabdus sp. W0125-5 TaxID=2999116 RepID=UPI0022F319EC|nr:DUF512 domain-containing protein [Oceanirhabdus sp. W0125-5]WBW99636.1 DUF512 domain-containing protein [Oceanirhabdus sp. W0125-5]